MESHNVPHRIRITKPSKAILSYDRQNVRVRRFSFRKYQKSFLRINESRSRCERFYWGACVSDLSSRGAGISRRARRRRQRVRWPGRVTACPRDEAARPRRPRALSLPLSPRRRAPALHLPLQAATWRGGMGLPYRQTKTYHASPPRRDTGCVGTTTSASTTFWLLSYYRSINPTGGVFGNSYENFSHSSPSGMTILKFLVIGQIVFKIDMSLT